MRTCTLNAASLWPLTRRARIVTLLVLGLALALVLWRLSVPSANAAEQIPQAGAFARA